MSFVFGLTLSRASVCVRCLPECVDDRLTVGPAPCGFAANGLFVWGFTAGLLDRLLRLAGWEQPWDREQVRPLPA